MLGGQALGLMHLWVQISARYDLWLHVLGAELESCYIAHSASTKTGMSASYLFTLWPVLSSFHY